jgi:hypothetical protein
MISPKEKAKELVEKFIEPTKVPNVKNIWVEDFQAAKQCALIAVDEILDLNLGFSNCDENNWAIEKFYIEVKQEIQKL